jgi:hypothetical protein
LTITLAGFKSSSILILLGLPKDLQLSHSSLEVNLSTTEVELPGEDHTAVLIAGAPSFPTKRVSSRFQNSTKVTRRALPHLGTSLALQTIYNHVLFPFSDLFYYFIESYNALKNASCYLEGILKTNNACGTGTRLILVIPSSADEKSVNWRDELLALFHQRTGTELLHCVQDVQALVMAEESTPKLKRIFRSSLLQGLWSARQYRTQQKRMFSTPHLTALLNYACDHISQSPSQPFDLISAVRTLYPVANDLGEHISRFFSHFKESDDLVRTGIPIFASSLLLDSFPRGSHC